MSAEPTTSNQAASSASGPASGAEASSLASSAGAASNNPSASEVLLTEVDVKQHKLYHHFQDGQGHDLGGYYKDHLTIYPAFCGRQGSGNALMQDLEHEIAANPYLRAFPRHAHAHLLGKPTHFDVLHLHAPPGIDELIRVEGGWKHGDVDYEQHCLHRKFETGHYRELARHAPCAPDRWGVLDERVLALLRSRAAFESIVREKESVIDVALADKAQAQRSIAKRRLFETDEGLRAGYAALAAQAAAITGFGVGRLEDGWQAKRGAIAYVKPGERNGLNDEIIELHLPDPTDVPDIIHSHEVMSKEKRAALSALVDIEHRKAYFSPTRMLSADELRNQRWLVLDTESVFFREQDQSVTHIPYAIMQGGRVVERVVMTVDNPGVGTLASKDGNEYVVRRYAEGGVHERSARMIRDFAAVARGCQNLCAYNAAYDLPTLRDEGDFRVGNRDSEPRKEVTLPFFVRVGVAGKRVVDPMRIAKMMVPHLVNAKADNVLAYLLGTESFKSISHNELGPLAHCAQGDNAELTANCQSLIAEEARGVGAGVAGENPAGVQAISVSSLSSEQRAQAASRVINRYAVNDVDFLIRALQSEQIGGMAFHAAHHLGRLYGSDYGRLLHLPSAINESQEWCYFRALGLWRSMVYLPTTDMMRRQAIGRGKVKDALLECIVNGAEEATKTPVRVREGPETHGIDGLHKDVVICRLPLGEILEPFVARNFPDASKWYGGLHKEWDAEETSGGKAESGTIADAFFRPDFVQHPLYRQFMNAFGESLAKWMVADVGLYLQTAAAFRNATQGRIGPEFMRVECRLQRMLREPGENAAYKLRKRRLPIGNLAFWLGDRARVHWESVRDKTYLSRGKQAESVLIEKIKQQQGINEFINKTYAGFVDGSGRRNPLAGFHQDLQLYERLLDKVAKVGGNFGVDADHVLGALQSWGWRVSDFIRKHKLSLVHKDGSYLYLKAGNAPDAVGNTTGNAAGNDAGNAPNLAGNDAGNAPDAVGNTTGNAAGNDAGNAPNLAGNDAGNAPDAVGNAPKTAAGNDAGKKAIRYRNAPWIPLDDIDSCLVTSALGEKKIFYKQRGFYKGLKRIEGPTWNLCHAEATLYDDVLFEALDGNVGQALVDGRDGLERLIRGGLDARNVREYLFKSNSGLLRYFFGVEPEVVEDKARPGEFIAASNPHKLFDGSKVNLNKVFYYDCGPEALGFEQKQGVWRRVERDYDDLVTVVKTLRVGERRLQFIDEPFSRPFYDRQTAHTSHFVQTRRRWFINPEKEPHSMALDVSQYALRAKERLCGLLAPFGVHTKHWLALRFWNDAASGAPLCVDLDNPLLPLDDVKQLMATQGTLFEGAPKIVRPVNVKRTIAKPSAASKKRTASKKPASGKKSSGAKQDGMLF